MHRGSFNDGLYRFWLFVTASVATAAIAEKIRYRHRHKNITFGIKTIAFDLLRKMLAGQATQTLPLYGADSHKISGIRGEAEHFHLLSSTKLFKYIPIDYYRFSLFRDLEYVIFIDIMLGGSRRRKTFY